MRELGAGARCKQCGRNRVAAHLMQQQQQLLIAAQQRVEPSATDGHVKAAEANESRGPDEKVSNDHARVCV
jgi:hypothetical protein